MLSNVDSAIFENSDSVTLLPVVSAEWNHNLFNPPYITVAGTGVKEAASPSSTYTSVTDSNKHPNFITKSFTMSDGTGSVSYSTSGLSGKAYKIVTYIKTDSPIPVMVTAFAKGSETQYGSENIEADSLGWTKVVTYIGSSESYSITTPSSGGGYFASFCSEGVAISDGGSQYSSIGQLEAWINANYTSVTNITYNQGSAPPLPNCSSTPTPTPTPTEAGTINSFVYTVSANSISGTENNPIVYFTLPEIYETTIFDFYNHSLFPTESPFTYFRPGESYVPTGDAKYSFPNNYRRIASKLLSSESASGGFFGNKYSPASCIIQNPSFFLASPPIANIKNVLASDLAPYKYFVSDSSSRSISAVYEKPVLSNKIVLKFNALMTIPTLSISITTVTSGTESTSSQSITPNASGVVVLYWTEPTWSTNKWETMPKFDSTGALSISRNVKKITVTQSSISLNSALSGITGISNPASNISLDLKRMHLIEVSPRLEIDLSDFVQNVDIDKSLDSGQSSLPISSINTNDARIDLSGIPAMNGSTLVPIFSSQSNQSLTILSNLLRKNIKFYINFNLIDHTTIGTTPNSNLNTYIPGGVFYSDSWEENDISNISVQCFDISRYLQSTPVPDYVANLKGVFEIITNILDMAGFTDYDYDSLYKICNNKSAPLDLAYYYCNSKDTTVLDALSQIFLAYQIGAYIDEYGVMKFLSLHDILSSTTSSMTISDSNILEGGFSISNNAKPGKISLRYQTPKIKQSPSLQNITDLEIKNSPSFIYTTSNDVVWQQQTMDSVGFNYLNADMSEDENVFEINNNDLLDIFHTFNMNNEGYVAIENEIVSFVYKEYELKNLGSLESKNVSVKNNLELSSEINKFVKEYGVGLTQKSAIVTDAEGDGVINTYYAENNFVTGDRVSINGMVPTQFNVSGTVMFEPTSSEFQILTTSHSLDPVTKVGAAFTASTADVMVTPTGKITNVKRGMFGTLPSEHARITSLSSKVLSEKSINYYYTDVSASNNASIINSKTNTGEITDSLPSIDKIRVETFGNNKTLIYPTDAIDIGYQTYSVKFDMPDQAVTTAGLFFNMKDELSTDWAYFVELVRYNKTIPGSVNLYDPPRYSYALTIRTDGYLIAWSDVTGECQSITNNFAKIINKTKVGNKYEYDYVTDNAFNLKAVRYTSDGSDGEDGTEEISKNILSVFLNNVEISKWQVPGDPSDPETGATGYKPTSINPLTGMRRKPSVANDMVIGTKFGFVSSSAPNAIDDLEPPLSYPASSSNHASSLREIHATKKPLKERSVSYFYQDREFLNGLIQNQSLASLSPSYLMQTTPEISGINVYDVQYTTPAAVSVDVLPIEYLQLYFPGNTPQDQMNYQKKIVDDYALAYSTPINTGFRAKIAIANNSPHMVFIRRDSDELIRTTVNFNLWTHEIVAPSDPEIIEKVVDKSNISEVLQLDSEWIQSKEAAYKMLKIVEMGLEGFSKTVSLSIFGNPLIQVGDIITLSYSLNGIDGQKYMVQSVAHSFSSGLSTSLKMNRIQ